MNHKITKTRIFWLYFYHRHYQSKLPSA